MESISATPTKTSNWTDADPKRVTCLGKACPYLVFYMVTLPKPELWSTIRGLDSLPGARWMSEGFWFPKDCWYKMIGGTWRFGYGLTLIHGIDFDICFNFQVLKKEYISKRTLEHGRASSYKGYLLLDEGITELTTTPDTQFETLAIP